MKIAVLGAGIGGKIAASGISTNFPNHEVYLIGKDSPSPSGLFYFNKKIPGIAEREIDVEYHLIGELNDESFKKYQIKSRGSYDPNVKISSFSKVGKTEKGYLLSNKIDLSRVNWIKSNFDYLSENLVHTESCHLRFYDKLISTVPIQVILKSKDLLDRFKDFKFRNVYVKEIGGIGNHQVTSIKVFYDLTDSPYYRHSSYYCFDQIIKIESETINPPEETKRSFRVMSPGKIFTYPDISSWINSVEEEKKIKFLGRYARWDYHWTVDQTYFEALKFAIEN